MFDKKILLFTGAAAVAMLAVKPVYSARVLLFNLSTGEFGSNGNQSVGWEFNVNKNLESTKYPSQKASYEILING